MKKLFTYAFLMMSLNGFAQLSKQIVEKEFPLLTLPYNTQGLLFTTYNVREPFDPAKVKFAKADISSIMKKYQNTNLIINPSAKHYAIGRLNFSKRNYILYLEASINTETKTGLNEIFIVSLDEGYQPINAQSISYYTQGFEEFKNPNYQIIKTNHAFSLITNKDNKLNVALTVINQEDKYPGDIHLQYTKDESELYFDDYGYINMVFKE